MAKNNSFLSSRGQVLVIGGAGLDLVGRLDDELRKGSTSPAKIRTSFGGVARNVAENLARLGQPVRIITAVGDDQNGELLLNQARQAGVDVSAVVRTPEHPTGTYLGILDQGGGLKFALDDNNATNAISPQYLRDNYQLFKSSALLFIDANLPKKTLQTIFSLAKRARLPVCADPTSTRLADRLLPHLSRLHIVTPNSSEAEILCEGSFEYDRPQQALEAAKCLVGQGVEITLITLAEFGVVYASSETSGHIPAMQTNIVDPTGAGGALTATVIYSLLHGIQLDDAVRLGVTAASLTLRHQGTVVQDLSLEMLYDQLVI